MTAIILDIEGTTTPMAFVSEVLFPYARTRLRSFLRNPANRGALRDGLLGLQQEWEAEPEGGPASFADADDRQPGRQARAAAVPVEYLEWLMDQDRKSPALKQLQGLIWAEGYRSGELHGEVFADVAPALRRWREAGVAVAIYSSGSELAQRLLFGSTAQGDLTPLIARFFDTAVGAKTSADSYRRIAAELGCPTGDALFVSDVTTELDAAFAAGCPVRLCERPGNRRQPPSPYPVVQNLSEVDTEVRVQ